MSKHSQTLFGNIKQHQTTSDTATHDDKHGRRTVEHDDKHGRRTVEHDRQRHTMNNERRTVDGNDRDTEQQHTGEWSKISTGLENGLKQKNAAQIFRATD